MTGWRDRPPDWSRVPELTHMPSRWRGPFRYRWHSVCSKLHGFDAERRAACPACNAGRWINVTTQRVDHYVYDRHRPLWLWWHNRPRSRSRRTLERIFPGLKGGR